MIVEASHNHHLDDDGMTHSSSSEFLRLINSLNIVKYNIFIVKYNYLHVNNYKLCVNLYCLWVKFDNLYIYILLSIGMDFVFVIIWQQKQNDGLWISYDIFN